jgi:hypothetical protein
MSASRRANVQGGAIWLAVAHYAIHPNPNAKCSGATELPGDGFTAHKMKSAPRHVRHQRSGSIVRCRSRRPQAMGAASGARKDSFCNFHIAIGDEKTNVANLITRPADSSIGGSILLLAN